MPSETYRARPIDDLGAGLHANSTLDTSRTITTHSHAGAASRQAHSCISG